MNAYHFEPCLLTYSVAPHCKVTKLPSHPLPPGFIDESLVVMDVLTSEVGLATECPVIEFDAIEIVRPDDELRTSSEWKELVLILKVCCWLSIPTVTG